MARIEGRTVGGSVDVDAPSDGVRERESLGLTEDRPPAVAYLSWCNVSLITSCHGIGLYVVVYSSMLLSGRLGRLPNARM